MECQAVDHFLETFKESIALNSLSNNVECMTLRKKAFESNWGNRENPGKQHFQLFYKVFYPLKDKI